MNQDKMKQQLVDRLAENYADFRAELLTKDRQELVDGAEKIAETGHVYFFMQNEHEYKPAELEHLLKFQNPLQVMADHWLDEFVMDWDNLEHLIPECCAAEDLNRYPLATDTKAPETLRKFLNVDVIASLQSIMGQITSFYQSDFEYNKKHILKAAQSEEPEKRSLLWLCRTNGTQLHEERDLFIKGTGAFNNVQFYHRDCQSEQVGLYSIEITGMKNGVVRGNIYERDRHQYAELTARGASLYTDDTLTFSGGKEVRIPHDELTHSKRCDLEFDYGKIVEIRHEADDESMVQGALKREHERREKLPKGRIDAHVQRLMNQRVQNEAERIVSAIQEQSEPNSPKQAHFMVSLSPYFIQIASTHDMDMLADKLAAHFSRQAFYFSVPEGEKKPHVFVKAEAVRQPSAERRKSIKEQLAAPPVPGDKPPTQKSKNQEVR